MMEVVVTTAAIRRAKLQSNQPKTDQHPVFHRPDAPPVTKPTV